MSVAARVVIFGDESPRVAGVTSALALQGYAVAPVARPRDAGEVLRRERPALVVSCDPGTEMAEAVGAARGLRIPTLAVADAAAADGVLDQFEDWVAWDRVEAELPARARRIVTRAEAASPAIDPRFLALVVHDLRTPLNVIGLTIRAIGQSTPSPTAEFEEDLTFLHENARQIERMLAQLGDYCRLVEAERQGGTSEFQTRRFLTDFLEEKQSKREPEFSTVRLEFEPDSPEEVAVDPTRARLAIQHALANAVAAAGDAPIRLRSRGPAGRWTIEVVVEKAPAADGLLDPAPAQRLRAPRRRGRGATGPRPGDRRAGGRALRGLGPPRHRTGRPLRRHARLARPARPLIGPGPHATLNRPQDIDEWTPANRSTASGSSPSSPGGSTPSGRSGPTPRRPPSRPPTRRWPCSTTRSPARMRGTPRSSPGSRRATAMRRRSTSRAAWAGPSGRLKDAVAELGSSVQQRLEHDLAAKATSIHWSTAWVYTFDQVGDAESSRELGEVLAEEKAHHDALQQGLNLLLARGAQGKTS